MLVLSANLVLSATKINIFLDLNAFEITYEITYVWNSPVEFH